MARDDGAELESLKREVEYLRSEHVALGHEHRKEMNEKEGMLAKRLKRAEKAEHLVSTLKRGRNELEQQLRAANDQVEGSGLEIGHLKREVKLLRTRSAEAKVRVADLSSHWPRIRTRSCDSRSRPSVSSITQTKPPPPR